MSSIKKSASLDREGSGVLKHLFNSLIGKAHKTGFDSPFLRSCLHVYAGGGRMPGPYTERYLINMGLVFENFRLTPNGEKLFRYMSHNTTSKPYMWALDMSDSKKVEAVLYPKEKEQAKITEPAL